MKGTATNADNVGAERRRLTDLEESLSRTLNFFKFDDSLSGAPSPQVPPQTTPARQPRQIKRFGVDSEDGTWSLFEGMDSLRESAEQEAEAERSRDRGARDPEDSTSDRFLDLLRQEDWLVNATFDDTFWGMPFAGRGDQGTSALWQDSEAAEREEELLEAPGPGERLSRMEQGFGATRVPDDPFGIRRDARAAAERDALHDLGFPVDSREAVRRNGYRKLIQFGASSMIPEAQPFLGSPVPAPLDEFMTPATVAAATSPLDRQERSLDPRPAAADPPGFPEAPAVPRAPSVFDRLEAEPYPAPATSPSTSYGSPFRQPPARSY